MNGIVLYRTCWRATKLLLLLVGSLAMPFAYSQNESQSLRGRVATLAFFLETADVIEPHTACIGTGLSFRRSPDGQERDLPTLTVSYGVHRRVEVDFSIPYFYSQYDPKFQMTGIGDRFLSSKIQLLNPDSHRIGLAFDPTLEILGKSSMAAGPLGPRKYNFALPLILQKNFSRLNLYAEGGYITRGAKFYGFGGDGAIYRRLGLAANLLYSKATRFNELSVQYGLLQSRWDAILGLYYIINPRVSVFTSAGRTISTMDANGTQYIINVGINLNFNPKQFLQGGGEK